MATLNAVSEKKIPNGEYFGIFGGYEGKFSIGEENYKVRSTELGIRGSNIPCIISVNGDSIKVIL